MFRSFSLVLALASLAATVVIAVAGSRPHQLYDVTWEARAGTLAAASPR
jgi:hypothetical protein